MAPINGIYISKFESTPGSLWLNSAYHDYLLAAMILPCMWMMFFGYRQFRITLAFLSFCAGVYIIEIVQITGQRFDVPTDWVCLLIAIGSGLALATLSLFVRYSGFFCMGIVWAKVSVVWLKLLCYILGDFPGYGYFEGYFTIAVICLFVFFSVWAKKNEYYHQP
jgi:hypothetical protein